MPANSSDGANSHTTTVKYNDSTKNLLDRLYPDALSDADAFRHAVSDARKFNKLVESVDLDTDDV